MSTVLNIRGLTRVHGHGHGESEQHAARRRTLRVLTDRRLSRTL